MRTAVKKILSIACALLVLVSFGMHAAQIEHSHFGTTHAHAKSVQVDHGHSDAGHANTDSESLSDKMHMADKKMFYVLLSAALLFVALGQSSTVSFKNIERIIRTKIVDLQKTYAPRAHSHISLLYKTGVLNPKLF